MQAILVLLLLALSLLIPESISAHIAGQPPFFLVNNKYAEFYPVSITSLKNFSLPQDRAPDTYLVATPISFAIDTQMLPFPEEIIQQTSFTWDFGDGEKASGLTNTYIYQKPGSYLLTITADYGDYSDQNTQPLLQAMLIHIIPTKNYQLPQAVISVNGKKLPIQPLMLLQVKTMKR